MTTLLIDTGPLVALLNRRDRHHAWVNGAFGSLQPPLFTCEAVLSEACFVLRQLEGGPGAVLELLSRGVVRCDFRLEVEVVAVATLMQKFADVPMSLADACLVRMTETLPRAQVLTLDSDFAVYRRNRRQRIHTIMPTDRPSAPR